MGPCRARSPTPTLLGETEKACERAATLTGLPIHRVLSSAPGLVCEEPALERVVLSGR